MRWTSSQLIPNLPPRSVLVIDNASYHNVPEEKAPTQSSLKKEMIQWLAERNIQHSDSMTKPELYEIIKANKPRPVYQLDKLLAQHGHRVLRLPPYHPDLNPIEKVWALVKNWVATHNVTYKLEDVEKLARRKFAEVSITEWANICSHVRKLEQEYINKENIFDTIEDFRFQVNTGESDDSSDDSDDDLSGIELLSE